MNNEPFVIERTFNASAARVWSAITDRDEMSKWYFDLEAFRPEVGFAFQFKGGPADDRQYLHLCQVTEVVPGTKLVYSWRYDGYEGISYVTFELIAADGKTTLRLTHSGLETFPANNPDLAAGNFAIGWTHIIGTSLHDYLK